MQSAIQIPGAIPLPLGPNSPRITPHPPCPSSFYSFSKPLLQKDPRSKPPFKHVITLGPPLKEHSLRASSPSPSFPSRPLLRSHVSPRCLLYKLPPHKSPRRVNEGRGLRDSFDVWPLPLIPSTYLFTTRHVRTLTCPTTVRPNVSPMNILVRCEEYSHESLSFSSSSFHDETNFSYAALLCVTSAHCKNCSAICVYIKASLFYLVFAPIP